MAAAAVPWAAGEIDPERVAAELARRFPGACVWFGEFTGRWWALTRRGLVEAGGPVKLGRRLEALAWAGRPRPVPPRGVVTGPHGRMAGSVVHPGSPSGGSGGARCGRSPRRRGWWRRLLGGLVVVEAR